jgi:tocopherol cyclase
VYSLRKIFNPSLFQGSLSKDNYFEGWYFKHVAVKTEDAFAVIPGISLSADSHAFIQYIDGASGKSAYFRYNIDEFSYDRSKFFIRIGSSVFTSTGIGLDLKNHNMSINGKIEYTDMATLPPTLLRPGIMGWYSYIPGMECNHGIISLNHFLAGTIYVNGRKKSFSGGKGYIEKDWGTSFPESWLWLQCNNFRDEYISVMISVAKIPWRGNFFIGFIAFVHFRGKTEIFATYNRAKVEYLRKSSEHKIEILLSKGKKKLQALISRKESIPLKAPVDGQMINRIKESISSEVTIEYSDNGKIVYSGNGIRAGFEENEGIYKYF